AEHRLHRRPILGRDEAPEARAEKLVWTRAARPGVGAVHEQDRAVEMEAAHHLALAFHDRAVTPLAFEQRALGVLLLADVARDFRRADDTPVIVDRRDGERHVDPAAILCEAYRLEVID